MVNDLMGCGTTDINVEKSETTLLIKSSFFEWFNKNISRLYENHKTVCEHLFILDQKSFKICRINFVFRLFSQLNLNSSYWLKVGKKSQQAAEK